MYQENKFLMGYTEDLKYQVLELPYTDKELSMVIVLPDDIEDETTGLQKVLRPYSLPNDPDSTSCVLVADRLIDGT